LETLDVKFKRHAGMTVSERIRRTRLDAAAVLLATTDKAVKEVWVQVGYNNHSNFDHDFKRRFQSTPRGYRRSTIRPAAQEILGERRHAAARTAQVENASANNGRVLIVDDDESTRTTLATWLRLQGHSVSLASSGTEGLVAIQHFSPDALLVDYHLGDMDGLQFLRSARQQGGRASAALFTADWELFERSSEAVDVHALIASKLCDLDQVNDLVIYLRGQPTEP